MLVEWLHKHYFQSVNTVKAQVVVKGLPKVLQFRSHISEFLLDHSWRGICPSLSSIATTKRPSQPANGRKSCARYRPSEKKLLSEVDPGYTVWQGSYQFHMPRPSQKLIIWFWSPWWGYPRHGVLWEDPTTAPCTLQWNFSAQPCDLSTSGQAFHSGIHIFPCVHRPMLQHSSIY